MRHARASQAFPNEWTPILRFGNWYHLAGVYGPNRTQLFVNGKLASEYRSPTSYLRDVPNAELHIGHDVRFVLVIALWSSTMDFLTTFASLLRATADTSLSAAYSSGGFGTFGFYVMQLHLLKYPTPLSFQ